MEPNPIFVPMTVSTDSVKIGMQVSTESTDLQMDVNTTINVTTRSLPPGGDRGDVLIKSSEIDFDAAWVPPAQRAEQDNTLPITSAAVYTEIGNINALLATI